MKFNQKTLRSTAKKKKLFSEIQLVTSTVTDRCSKRTKRKRKMISPIFFLSFLLRALPEKTWTTQDTKTAGGDATLSFGLRLFKTSGPSHSELFLDCTHTQHVKGRKINTIKKDQKHRI